MDFERRVKMRFSSDEQKAFIKDVEAAYDSMRMVYGRERQTDSADAIRGVRRGVLKICLRV